MQRLLPSFERRIYLPEQMDAEDCDADKLRRTYTQLAIINRLLSRMRGLLQRHVIDDAKASGGTATVVELGCGGGDVLHWLAKRASRCGLSLTLIGIDSDPRAVARAKQRLSGHANVSVIQGGIDALYALPVRPDYLFCNHVLHHIPPDDLVPVLRKLHGAVNRRLLINDLERSAAAYVLYTALAALAFHRSFVFADGRLSIRKGFRVRELRQACEQAGFGAEASVQRVRPWRVVVTAEAAR